MRGETSDALWRNVCKRDLFIPLSSFTKSGGTKWIQTFKAHYILEAPFRVQLAQLDRVTQEMQYQTWYQTSADPWLAANDLFWGFPFSCLEVIQYGN